MTSINHDQSDLIMLDERYFSVGIAVIRLNRPKALQALNLEMVQSIKAVLEQLSQDDSIRAIWIESSTAKAFCAGGDVRAVRQAITQGRPEQADAFFSAEYELDMMLHYYDKPVIVWGEGYVMGGGLGLMMACPFRIITDKTKCAMPEVQIGLFPDVGASRFLSECGRLGLFLGLTGSIVDSSDVYSIRWATHISKYDRSLVLDRISQIDWQAFSTSYLAIDDALRSIHKPLAASAMQESLDSINSLCRGDNFEQDYQALLTLTEAQAAWLKTVGDNVQAGSPSTIALTWLLWHWAKNKSWALVYQLEYQLAAWKIRHPDFCEGVRARLVDKDLEPKWINQDRFKINEILPELPDFDDQDWRHLLDQHSINTVS